MLDVEQLDRDRLAECQGLRLAKLLQAVKGRNPFYTRKLDDAGIDVGRLRLPEDFRRLPMTTKAELNADQAANPPWGTALTEPLDRYTRYCQTSSSTGRPLRWIDTNESWQWLLECWKAVYRGARVNPGDRVFFPFSFGPFLGFWAGFEAGPQIGLHCVPGGGMSSQIRLSMIESIGATVVCCTPTYALRLAEIAEQERAQLGRARHRSSRPDRSRAGELRVLGSARLTAYQRGRIHFRGARSEDRPRGERWSDRGTGADQPGTDGQPGDPLPHGRYRRPPFGAVSMRPHVGAPRRRHPGTRRRHGEHSRGERVPRRD
jgi:hypothetical protein